MEFKKKLKIRLALAILWLVLGVGAVVVAFITKTDNEYISSFGFAIALIGVVRLREYFVISKNEETMRKREIAETDERNLSIMHKSRSAAFLIYTVVACLAVIALTILEMHDIAKIVSLSVCSLIVIYWVCYFFYQKKS